MAFTVETGAVVANSNAYVALADFVAFHSDRGKDLTGFSDSAKESAIIRATDYVDKRFGVKFIGCKKERTQSLMWPRSDAWTLQGDRIESTEIPMELKRAVYEYAFLALYITLLPVPAASFNAVDPVTGETSIAQGGLLQRTKQKVGPIEEETWFNQEQWRLVLNGRAPGVSSEMVSMVNLPEYPVADEWLKPIVRTGMNIQLARG